MSNTYLTTAYKDRERVKALGARWDAEARKWFVPEGRALTPFAAWLPAVGGEPVVLAGAASSSLAATGSDVVVPVKGVSLSSLLGGVARAISDAYRSGAWTTAEVLKVDARRGHVYLELAERDAQGTSVAQARGVIWADTANVVVPAFEQATGVVLGAGIKLLVRAKPTMHALYGLSLVVDAIDPDYTLGDLEARKREIRQRLQREGLFDLNRQLPAPWDFNEVLVVAPQGAAGLGDFDAEAQRLARFGVCRFDYAFSRFQGEGAAREVLQALNQAMDACRARGAVPDAVVIIRGGGAVNDLAWLNDYDLARAVCELEVPVFTGIGHERDNTVLDEVAHTRFDTPSKVILGIEQVIVRRVQEAKANFAEIVKQARQATQSSRAAVEQAHQTVLQRSQRQIGLARDLCRSHFNTVQTDSLRSLHGAVQAVEAAYSSVRTRAVEQLAQARQVVPALLGEVRMLSRQSIHDARLQSRSHLDATLDRARRDNSTARQSVQRGMDDVRTGARQQLVDARLRAEALVREVLGQGPDKTLGRGFAIVRAGGAEGAAVTSAEQIEPGQVLDIQLRDGHLSVRASPKTEQE